MTQFERTERLIGKEAQQKLQSARVAVFGLGGVGGHAAEALMRAGIGQLLLVDGDAVDITNLNRQLFALHSTVGLPKAVAALQRARDINPHCVVDARRAFFGPENADQFDFHGYHYVLDCIDTVQSKLLLIERAKAHGAMVVSCMGAGNKLDPTRFEVADIKDTSVCPLARVMRRELGRRGIENVQVVYSKEPPVKPTDGERAPASISFVPAAAGLVMAGVCIRGIAGV